MIELNDKKKGFISVLSDRLEFDVAMRKEKTESENISRKIKSVAHSSSVLFPLKFARPRGGKRNEMNCYRP